MRHNHGVHLDLNDYAVVKHERRHILKVALHKNAGINMSHLVSVEPLPRRGYSYQIQVRDGGYELERYFIKLATLKLRETPWYGGRHKEDIEIKLSGVDTELGQDVVRAIATDLETSEAQEITVPLPKLLKV